MLSWSWFGSIRHLHAVFEPFSLCRTYHVILSPLFRILLLGILTLVLLDLQCMVHAFDFLYTLSRMWWTLVCLLAILLTPVTSRSIALILAVSLLTKCLLLMLHFQRSLCLNFLPRSFPLRSLLLLLLEGSVGSRDPAGYRGPGS